MKTMNMTRKTSNARWAKEAFRVLSESMVPFEVDYTTPTKSALWVRFRYKVGDSEFVSIPKDKDDVDKMMRIIQNTGSQQEHENRNCGEA